MPGELRCEPALSRLFCGVKGIVQKDRGLFHLSCQLTCSGAESSMVGHPHLGAGITISRRTVAHEKYTFRCIAILEGDPPAIERSNRVRPGDTMFDRHRH